MKKEALQKAADEFQKNSLEIEQMRKSKEKCPDWMSQNGFGAIILL